MIEKNAKVPKDIKKQRKQAEILGIIDYQHIQIKNIIQYLIMTIVN